MSGQIKQDPSDGEECFQREQIKSMPEEGSLEFPKLFTLFGHRVGFRYSGDLSKKSGVRRIFMLPAGRVPADWKQFDITPTDSDIWAGCPMFEDELDCLKKFGERFHRPILAEAVISNENTFSNLKASPELLRKAKEGTKIAEISYGILTRFRYPELTPSLLRRSICTELITELELEAKKNGIRILTARVRSSNSESTTLLKKSGFNPSENPSENDICLYYKILYFPSNEFL